MFVLCGLVVLTLGVAAQGLPSRIVGGHDAPNHKYPYQVSLQNAEIGHLCSGSILNEHWILTAAHCVDDSVPKNYQIAVGTNFLNVSGDTYQPRFAVIHEKYENFFFYDIALIRVVGKIKFHEFVKPIILPVDDLENYSLPAIMAGWGRLSANGPIPNELQEIELKVISPAECKQKQDLTTVNHICTFTKYGEGICMGDSGGPLVVNGIQVGIASYVRPCGIGHPDVYTRVWSYMDWINNTMQRFDNIFY